MWLIKVEEKFKDNVVLSAYFMTIREKDNDRYINMLLALNKGIQISSYTFEYLNKNPQEIESYFEKEIASRKNDNVPRI